MENSHVSNGRCSDGYCVTITTRTIVATISSFDLLHTVENKRTDAGQRRRSAGIGQTKRSGSTTGLYETGCFTWLLVFNDYQPAASSVVGVYTHAASTDRHRAYAVHSQVCFPFCWPSLVTVRCLPTTYLPTYRRHDEALLSFDGQRLAANRVGCSGERVERCSSSSSSRSKDDRQTVDLYAQCERCSAHVDQIGSMCWLPCSRSDGRLPRRMDDVHAAARHLAPATDGDTV